MAKSLRSKWKRKCRAIKRIRYGQKELERLKKTVANDPIKPKTEIKDLIADIQEVANVKTSTDIQTPQVQSDVMEIEEIRKEFNPKTLRDKNGAYPVWVHPRKIKTGKKTKKKPTKKHTKKPVKRID